LLRELDCAVIEALHTFEQDSHQQPFDSIRGVFTEGKELYPKMNPRSYNYALN